MKEDVLARFEVREVAERYFWALDRRDFKALESCFAPDVQFDLYDGRVKMRSAAEVVEGLRGVAAHEATHHAWSNGDIMVDGARATAIIHAIAYCVQPESEGHRVRVRGLRYEDAYALGEAGAWRITVRRHVPVWQFDAEAISNHLLK